jgi:protein-arginine kinase activator protein McsA
MRTPTDEDKADLDNDDAQDMEHRRWLGEAPAFTCPRCGMTSHHPVDARERYCANCHRFADEAPLP